MHGSQSPSKPQTRGAAERAAIVNVLLNKTVLSRIECEALANRIAEALRQVSAAYGGRTIELPELQLGDVVQVDCAQYRGPGLVEQEDGQCFRLIGDRLCVLVRPWIGDLDGGYAHSNRWFYPADDVRLLQRSCLQKA